MNKENVGKWCTCRDHSGELYDGDYFETKEEAIVAFRKELADGGFDQVKKQGYFWVGQTTEHTLEQFVFADRIIEDAQCQASDVCGEVAEDWLSDVTNDQIKELEGVICNWMREKNFEPTFMGIINSEKVMI